MTRWVGPVSWGLPESPRAITDANLLRSRARYIVGQVENDLRLGQIWFGRKFYRLAPNAYVVVQVDRTYEDNPIVKAELVVNPPDQGVEDSRFAPLGIVWKFDGSDTDLFFQSRTEGDTVINRVFSNIEDADGLVDTALDVPSYIPGLYADKIESGTVDWQGDYGTLTWAGPKTRSVVGLFQYAVTFGQKIYEGGDVLYDFTGTNFNVVGAAKIDGNTVRAIGVEDSLFVVYEIDLADESHVSVATLNRTQNGEEFLPRSCAFFSPDGLKASMVVDNLDNLSADAREEVWCEVTLDGLTFEYNDFYRPKAYDIVYDVRQYETNYSELTLGTSEGLTTADYTIQTAEIQDISASEGHSWAEATDTRLICRDYRADGTEATLEVTVVAPEFVTAALSYSDESGGSSTFQVDQDGAGNDRGDYPEYDTSFATRDSAETVQLHYGGMDFKIDGELVHSMPYTDSYHEAESDRDEDTATSFLSSRTGSASGTTTIENYVLDDVTAAFRQHVVYADLRFGNVCLYYEVYREYFTSTETISRERSGLAYDDDANELQGTQDATQTLSFSELDDAERNIYYRGATIQDFEQETNSESATTESSTTISPEPTYADGSIVNPTVIDDESTTIGGSPFHDNQIDAARAVVNENPNSGSTASYIGSGMRTLSNPRNEVDAATAQRGLAYVDLLKVTPAPGSILQTTTERYRINGQDLENIIFPTDSFDFDLSVV